MPYLVPKNASVEEFIQGYINHLKTQVSSSWVFDDCAAAYYDGKDAERESIIDELQEFLDEIRKNNA